MFREKLPKGWNSESPVSESWKSCGSVQWTIELSFTAQVQFEIEKWEVDELISVLWIPGVGLKSQKTEGVKSLSMSTLLTQFTNRRIDRVQRGQGFGRSRRVTQEFCSGKDSIDVGMPFKVDKHFNEVSRTTNRPSIRRRINTFKENKNNSITIIKK